MGVDLICEYDRERDEYTCHLWDNEKKVYETFRGKDIEIRNVLFNYFEAMKQRSSGNVYGFRYESKFENIENQRVNSVIKNGEWDKIYAYADELDCSEEDGRVICVPLPPIKS